MQTNSNNNILSDQKLSTTNNDFTSIQNEDKIFQNNIKKLDDQTQKKKIEEINKKEYLIEHYVEDEKIIEEYKELFAPIKKRLKYTFYFNVALCSFSLIYAKNLGFYLSKYFPNISKSLLNLVLFSSLHAVGFSAVLIGGNLAILGINPKKFLAKYREIDEKIMATDPYKDLTLQGFIEGISEGFNKKAEITNENNNNKEKNKIDDDKI